LAVPQRIASFRYFQRRPAKKAARGTYEEFSAPLTAVRKELFGMLAANDAQSMLAEACLIAIEELRDEHGRIDEEPRHPDVESGRAWPREASATEYECAIATPVSR
jgi:hypothetical protein